MCGSGGVGRSMRYWPPADQTSGYSETDPAGTRGRASVTRLVIDASVIVRWVLLQRHDEADTDQALAVLEGMRSGRGHVHQPVHWLAEVASVLVRLSPDTAAADVTDLYAMNLPVEDGPEVYLTACDLAHDLNLHVFDTLYHAVALTLPGTVLVTADARYERNARRRGAVVLLRDLSVI